MNDFLLIKYMFSMALILKVMTLASDVELPGHLKPLGSHQPAKGEIAVVQDIAAKLFYSKYVAPQQPVIIQGLLSGSKPLLEWNDQYLANSFGHEDVTIDLTKYENRSISGSNMRLLEFLNIYNESLSMYLVSTLPEKMQNDFPLPGCLNCDWFTSRLQDFVLWFSSGGTNSLLHYDNVENLYCQISGSKRWIMVDPQNGSKHIIEDHPEGQYSSVNVTMIDMEKFPGLKDVPWWRAKTYPGDCIYVPTNWWHQVHSEDGRNMACNIWWAPLIDVAALDKFPCHDDNEATMLSKLIFTPGEWMRWLLSRFLQQNGGKADFQSLHDSIIFEHSYQKLITMDSFGMLDADADGFLEFQELLKLPPHVIHAALQNVEIGAMYINTTSKKNINSGDDENNFTKKTDKPKLEL